MPQLLSVISHLFLDPVPPRGRAVLGAIFLSLPLHQDCPFTHNTHRCGMSGRPTLVILLFLNIICSCCDLCIHLHGFQLSKCHASTLPRQRQPCTRTHTHSEVRFVYAAVLSDNLHTCDNLKNGFYSRCNAVEVNSRVLSMLWFTWTIKMSVDSITNRLCLHIKRSEESLL